MDRSPRQRARRRLLIGLGLLAGGRTPVEDLETHLVLRDGVMTLRPLQFGVAGGDVVGTLALDGRARRAGVDGNFEFRRIDLRRLFPGNATLARSAGRVGGRADLQGAGNSLAEVLGDADGSLGLAMAGGQVSNLVLELAGLDAGEALRTPVHLRGTFKDPAVQLDDRLAIRGGIAAILGAVAGPVAALLESGPGDDADCEALVAAVRRAPTTGSSGTGAP